MKIKFIVDSLELNGGCVMFLEILNAFQKYTDHNVQGIVVSKTGHYGRKELCSEDLPISYIGNKIKTIQIDDFKKEDMDESIIIHHRNAFTKPLSSKSKYIVINHTVDRIEKMEEFKNADEIVSVCNYINHLSSKFVKSKVILNGIENDFINEIQPYSLDAKFKTGRCHRLVSSKFRSESLKFLKQLNLPNHRHYLIGPWNNSDQIIAENSNCFHFGAIFDKNKKFSILKNLDVYFYDTYIKEGASVAILESLACGVPVIAKPLGGNVELIRHGVNGFLFNTYNEARKYLNKLYYDRALLDKMKKQTLEDFNTRLHILKSINKYKELL